jgi:hypothetical protein
MNYYNFRDVKKGGFFFELNRPTSSNQYTYAAIDAVEKANSGHPGMPIEQLQCSDRPSYYYDSF